MKKWSLLLLVGLFLNVCATLQGNNISLEMFCKENDAQVNDVVFEWFPVSINDWWLYEGCVGYIKKLVFKASVKNIIDAEGVTSLEMGYEVNHPGFSPNISPDELFVDNWITVWDNIINFGASCGDNYIEFPLKDGTTYHPFGPDENKEWEWVVNQEKSKNQYLDKSFKLQLYLGNKHPIIYTRWYKKGIGIVKYTTEEFNKSTNKYDVTTEFILKDCSINLLNK